MTTDYFYEKDDDRETLWTNGPPVSFSCVSRYRHWLFPALVSSVVLILIIVLGVTNMKTSNRLSSAEQKVSNLSNIIQSLNTSLQQAQDSFRAMERLQFAVDRNTDQMTLVSDALKHLSVVESLSRTVASLRCSLDHIINNSSAHSCCPTGWLSYKSSCYLFSSDQLTWNESRTTCERHDAQLLMLHDDKEWDFVTQHSVPMMYWIGLQDWRTGRWEWINRTPYTMQRRRWVPGQPDDWTNDGLSPEGEDCAHLHRDGHLNDLHCSSHLHYICQKRSIPL